MDMNITYISERRNRNIYKNLLIIEMLGILGDILTSNITITSLPAYAYECSDGLGSDRFHTIWDGKYRWERHAPPNSAGFFREVNKKYCRLADFLIKLYQA